MDNFSSHPPDRPFLASTIRQPLIHVLLWGGWITALSLLPGKTLPAFEMADWLALDKLAHLLLYGIWAALWFRWKRTTGTDVSGGSMAAGLLFMGGYGAILEVLQWAMEADRYFEVPDIVANIIGILLSYGINFLIYKMC
ncbi:MAG: VanZ family protein [Lewinellaceae bacterium]|nr:VanZ family protein [Saprospiraceae bacterium]MCB9313661.1 VanZ family protein [Lewinellaceae bacterium]